MTLLFVVILMVIAGLVAAAGDRMGHRAARARIRIGNLRPRTASTIIAVVTGVLISVVTFGVVFASWPQFREALSRYTEVRAAWQKAQAELKTAQEELTRITAESELRRKELDQKNEDVKQTLLRIHDLTVSLAKTEQDLRGTNQNLKRADAKVKEKERLQAALAAEVGKLDAQRQDLESSIAGAKINIEAIKTRAGEADLLMPKEQYLAYGRVDDGAGDGPKAALQAALDRVSVRMSAQGIPLAEESQAAAEQFLAEYPYSSAGMASVIIVKAARNLFRGEELSLAFEARELKPLAKAGDVVLEVQVSDVVAVVRALSSDTQEIRVPAKFDKESLVDFTVALHDVYGRAALEAGFLPDLRSGDMPSPVDALANVADDLLSHTRPFTIQFVAKAPATAIDALTDAEIRILNAPTP